MAKENVKNFCEQLMESKELQEKLKLEDAAYAEKQKSEEGVVINRTEEEKRDIIANIILPVAKEAGFEFTTEEWLEVAKEAEEKQKRTGELSDDELDAVAGGWAGCFIIGVTDGEVFGCTADGIGFCEYVGVGLMGIF